MEIQRPTANLRQCFLLLEKRDPCSLQETFLAFEGTLSSLGAIILLSVYWSQDVTHIEADACRYLACPRGIQFVNKQHEQRAGALPPGAHPFQAPDMS